MFGLIKKIFSASNPSTNINVGTASPFENGDENNHLAVPRQSGSNLKKQGNVLLAQGKLPEAAQLYLQAVETDPDDIEGHINLGYVFGQQKRYRDAEIHLKEAMRIDALNADCIFMLANLSQDQKNQVEAKRYFNILLTLKPTYDIAYRALVGLEMYEEAVARCDEILRSEPNHIGAHVNRGIALQALARHDDALIDFDRALKITSDHSETHFQRGISLNALGSREAAAEAYREVIRLNPDHMGAHNNLGTIFLNLNRYDEALDSFKCAVRIKPDNAEAYLNQGTALLNLRRHQDALKSWENASKLKPELAEPHFFSSQCLLQMGEFQSGWKAYEWRWRRENAISSRHDFGKPLWLGRESLFGKTVLLYSEQGLGDTIQFCRYAKKVSDLGATVFLLVPLPLKSLLGSLEGVSQILVPGQLLPTFDFQCPLLSLPLAFETSVESVPANVPYLTASPEITSRIRGQIGGPNYFKIGLCWKGGTSYIHDADRSPGIAPFRTLVSQFIQGNLRFYTLLPDSRTEFVQLGGEDLGFELDSNTEPFVETAALILNLDLVITCDTSIGHLAGALGKPVWLVLPFSPDWRWIINRDDSPWYPKTRLFRQNTAGDWSELFGRVTNRLAAVIDGTSELIWPANTYQPAPDVVANIGTIKP